MVINHGASPHNNVVNREMFISQVCGELAAKQNKTNKKTEEKKRKEMKA